MGDSRYLSWGWKTNDIKRVLLQKSETATKYAQRVPVVGIDIEILVQIQMVDFFETQNLFCYMLIQIFVNLNKEMIAKNRNKSKKKTFREMKTTLLGFSKTQE